MVEKTKQYWSTDDQLRAERIAEALGLIKDNGIPQKEVAARLGVSPQAVTKWKTTGQIHRDYLLQLARLAGENPEYLMTGDLEVREQPATYGASSFVTIPPVDNFYDAAPDFIKNLSFRADWLQESGLDPDHLSVAMVHGRSMEPLLCASDVILLDMRENSLDKVQNERVYALTFNNRPLVKRLFVQETDDLLLMSDNQRGHKDILIEKRDLKNVQIIGRVCWRGGAL